MAEPVMLSEGASAALEAFNSVKVSLADLCAKGTAQYAHKNYEAAADIYAHASELQAELNGEMSPDNAEILFLYGRSLFKVGQQKSDVLGGRAQGEEKKKKTNGVEKKKQSEAKTESEKIAEEGVAIVAEQIGAATKPEDLATKPLFQFTGDENFDDDSDDDETAEDADGAEGEEEEEDDLAVAFEVLDLARVLFTKRLESPEPTDDTGKGKETGDSPMTKHIKERLADTHDLLAEIALENEKFTGAVTDFRAALQHKQELYPEESEVIAEAHFKLSLALEFASIQPPTTENGEDAASKPKPEDPDQAPQVDEAMRAEAVTELELAIASTKLKLNNKEVELATSNDPDENDSLRSQIAEVKEIVTDMEGRLAELRKPPVHIKEALAPTKDDIMGGILGAMLGESPADAAARVEEAKKTATDLTGMVRRKEKKAAASEVATNGASTNGKRKAEEDSIETESKKAKVEDVAE